MTFLTSPLPLAGGPAPGRIRARAGDICIHQFRESTRLNCGIQHRLGTAPILSPITQLPSPISYPQYRSYPQSVSDALHKSRDRLHHPSSHQPAHAGSTNRRRLRPIRCVGHYACTCMKVAVAKLSFNITETCQGTSSFICSMILDYPRLASGGQCLVNVCMRRSDCPSQVR
jgi:hypothetical protein